MASPDASPSQAFRACRPQPAPRAGHEAGAVLVLLAALLAGCTRGEGDAHRLRPDDVAVVAAGKQVYDRHCAACHGAKLEGQPDWRLRDASGRLPAPPHDASGHTWHHPDEVLFRIVKDGVAQAARLKDYQTAMPVYAGVLSDAEIVAVLSYIKANWPEDIRRRHDELNAMEARKKKD
jgi:mono/diheme cytochrome c family protein